MLTPNPALYTNTDPVFKDNAFVPGREARRNNAAIWENLEKLDFSDASLKTILADADLFLLADQNDLYLTSTYANIKARLLSYFSIVFDITPVFRKFRFENWAFAPTFSGQARKLAFGEGVFIALTDASGVWRSTDNGASWIFIPLSVTTGGFTAIAYGDGVFIALADNEQAVSSDGGLTWVFSITGIGGPIADLGFGNGVFIALNSTNDGIYRSANAGGSWSLTANPNDSTAHTSVAFGNGVFIVTGIAGTVRILRSTDDGQNWVAVTGSPSVQNWQGSTYGTDFFNQSMFVVVAQAILGYSMDDGVTWFNLVLPNLQWKAVDFSGNVFVMVAEDTTGSTGLKTIMYSNYSIFNLTQVAAGYGWQAVKGGSENFVTIADDRAFWMFRSP